MFIFFKQKTAYDMRMSDGSSDVCSSDLQLAPVSAQSQCAWFCAISLGWWISRWSMPPVWMSNCAPRYFLLITEHSRCQPGAPRPQGESHSIWRFSPGGDVRQIAKSWRLRLPATGSIRPSAARSEEHTSELQSLMRISYAVFCLKKKIPDTY